MDIIDNRGGKQPQSIDVHNKAHLSNVLYTGEESLRARVSPNRKTAPHISLLKKIGNALIWPLRAVDSIVRSIRNNKKNQKRDHASLHEQPLPYYQPVMRVDGKAIDRTDKAEPVKHTAVPMATVTKTHRMMQQEAQLEEQPFEKRRYQKEKEQKQNKRRTPSSASAPSISATAKTKRTRRRAKSAPAGVTTAAKGKRSTAFKVGLGVATAAFMGMFSFGIWYMLEGRFLELQIVDDGNYVEVRTANRNVAEILEEYEIEIVPEDVITPALAEDINKETETIGIERARDITINYGDDESADVKLVGTVEDAILKAGIEVEPEDQLSHEMDDVVTQGMEVMIWPASNVTISTMDGKKSIKLVGTVKDALQQTNVSYTKDDEISPSLATELEPGMKIKVVKVTYETKTETKTIKHKSVTENSSKVLKGVKKVSQQGQDGKQETTYKITYKDGKKASSKVVSEKMLQPVKNKITLVGTSTSYRHNEGYGLRKPPAGQIQKTVTIDQVTAYTHTGRRTATGLWPRVGYCAVDPKMFPYGTKLFIPGYGYAVAQDTYKLKDYTHIDLFMESRGECTAWGRKRNVTVYVVK